MGRARTIARRGFLIGSAALVGGVAFGVYKARAPHDNPLEHTLGAGEATFNPWVKIGPEDITLVTPHADKGQGVAHMQATLIAEELDLEHGQFEIDFGQPASAYFNTGFVAEAGEIMSALMPVSAPMVETAMAPVLKLGGVQATGGSTSAADSFDKLRMAGAVARETLKQAAAITYAVPASTLRTQAGTVILPDGRRVPYTDLAETAATIPPVQDIELRAPSDWRLIGHPMERLDMVAKSTGTLPFGIDIAVEDMVHATVRLNPRRTGLVSYDADDARRMRGVLDIVEITGGVAVVADNTWRAIQAAEAIDCVWEQAPYPAEQAGHWAVLHEALDTERGLTWRDDGDVDARDTDDVETVAAYRAPYVAHQPLEPLNAIIRVTDSGAEIWTGHQIPQLVRNQVAELTGHHRDDVVFHNRFMGGSFGHRFELTHITACAEIAAGQRGRAVKLTLSREEDFRLDFPRHIAMARGAGSARDGRVERLDLTIASASPLISQSERAGMPAGGPGLQIAAGAYNAPYDVANFRVRAITVAGLAPTSSWRSVGASTAGFFLESLMDEVIHAAGADPLEERLRLCNDRAALGCLEAVAEMSGWDGRDLGANRGRGVALVSCFGVPVAEVVEVTQTDAGIAIDRVFVAADVGRVIDPVNFENQVQGGVVWGLGHAINSEITYADGIAEQQNYYDAEGMRLHQCPEIIVRALETQTHVRGIGEPPVPPAAPALANAIFAATGTRLREMPFAKFMDFV